jgi:ABC-type multidrug transport system fused ATPase/permease subunit
LDGPGWSRCRRPRSTDGWHGNRYLARILGEAADSAGRTGAFLGERYRRIGRRWDKKKAIVAVGRSPGSHGPVRAAVRHYLGLGWFPGYGLRLAIAGDDGVPRPILQGIDLRLDRGEAVGVVGGSGSGKSMTLRCIARLTPSRATVTGGVLVGGRDVNRLRGRELRRFRQAGVGYVFQDPWAAINPMHSTAEESLPVASVEGFTVRRATCWAAER